VALAILSMLLCGGLASAQTSLGKPVPATGVLLPVIRPGNPGELPPMQPPSDVQRAALQGRLVANPPVAEEGAEYEIDLELPSMERILRLESEQAWQERLKQKQLDMGKPPPVFPVYTALGKDRYYGRQWPQQGIHVEPNCVWYGRLYFEQKNFERQGWDLGPISPIVETLVFGADVATLPYHVATDPFRCYEWNTGYCLPGDPTPLLLYPLELSATGAVAEVGTIVTLIAAFP
jgi:hypothetical protein